MTGQPQFNVGVGLPKPSSLLTNGDQGYTPSEDSTIGPISDEQHDGEDTPLLSSRSTSRSVPRTLDSGSSAGRRRHQYVVKNSDHDDDDHSVQHSVTRIRAACICFSMWILMFMQACNMSGMTMIQGHVAEDLEAYEGAMWFTSVYLIVTASTGPLAGRLATIFPLRSMILGAAFFFTVGAVITSQAASFAVFLVGRTLTGIGGGCIMTLALILILQLTSRRRRGLFVGMVNAGFTIGISTGAIVFGVLLPLVGWRSLFLLQAPVAVVAGIGVYYSIPIFSPPPPTKKMEDRSTTWQKLKTIDYTGAVLLISSIVLFLYGLSGTIRPLPMILSIIPLGLFVLNEYKIAPDPLIPVSILQSRGVLLSCLSQLGLMSARWTIIAYAPIFVLAVRGLSPTVAGAVLVPTNLGFGVGGVLVGWLHVRRAGSFWLPCLVSICLFTFALLGLSLTSDAASPAWLYVVLVFANGFCTGAALNYTLAHLLHVSSPGTHYISTSLLATFRGFAGSFGTSIGGGIFTRRLRSELIVGFTELDGHSGSGNSTLSPERETLIRRLVGGPNLVFGGGLSEVERGVAIHGYEVALRVMYTSAVLLMVFVLLIQAGTGWTEPADQEDEEEIREEINEHDGTMEV